MAHQQKHNPGHELGPMYARYAGMILTAAVLMYLFTYLNTYRWSHIHFSEERVYMTLTMTAMMAVVMLTFMRKMLTNRRVNLAIYTGSIILFAAALWLARSEITVGDVSYMRAMIPHHSIAILTSERARISDPRVRELADEIMAAQRREISMMKVLISDIKEHGARAQEADRSVAMLRLKPEVPTPSAESVQVPEGFRAEIVMHGLTYPTSVEFDDTGAMYVAEAGYSYGDSSVKPRILHVSSDGEVTIIAEGPPLSGPITDLLWHEGRMYIAHRGKISLLESDGRLRDIVSGLLSDGDHHNNQLSAGPDGKIYFGQGTASNSGVIGPDNFKMGWLKEHPNLHDIPARNIRLVGDLFESENPLQTTDEVVRTLPFHAFGDKTGLTVSGQVKASGTILRMNADGSDLEVHAWGLRNPFGLMWSPDGTLYATENGFDVRGSRPIANDEEDIYIIQQDAWYGWPDFAMGQPVTNPRFKPKDKPQPQFLMAEHPPVEQPWMNFPKHSAIAKLDFSRTDSFGTGQMFVAFFGHMAPMTGEAPDEHGGHRVVRINPATKKHETFFEKKREQGHGGSHGSEGDGHKKGGDASSDESFSAGPRRLLDVRFSPDGEALYIADFGAMAIQAGAVPVPETGLIWRVLPADADSSDLPMELTPPQ